MIPVPQTGNNWNFNALLVRMQNGIGILENTLAVPYEIRSSHDLTIPPSGYHGEIKIYAHTKPRTPFVYFYNHLLARNDGTCGGVHWQRSLETTWRRSECRVTGKQELHLNLYTPLLGECRVCTCLSLHSFPAKYHEGKHWVTTPHSAMDETWHSYDTFELKTIATTNPNHQPL